LHLHSRACQPRKTKDCKFENGEQNFGKQLGAKLRKKCIVYECATCPTQILDFCLAKCDNLLQLELNNCASAQPCISSKKTNPDIKNKFNQKQTETENENKKHKNA